MLYGSVIWTIENEEKRRIKALEMWFYKRMQKINLTDRIANKVVLYRVLE